MTARHTDQSCGRGSLANSLEGDPLPWLLEYDEENPGVSYCAQRDILDIAELRLQVGTRPVGRAYPRSSPAGAILRCRLPLVSSSTIWPSRI